MVKLTASEWELYSSQTGVEQVAKKLNTKFNTLVKNAKVKIATGKHNPSKVVKEVRDAMFDYMGTFQGYGARDTEPECVVCELLEKEFKIEVSRW